MRTATALVLVYFALVVSMTFGSIAYGSDGCRDLFSRTARRDQDLTYLEFDPQKIALFKKSRYVYEAWSAQITKTDGMVYRGMALSSNELKDILVDKMKMPEAEFYHGRGIYAADQPNIAFLYPFIQMDLTKQKNLMVFFEIDPTHLNHIIDKESAPKVPTTFFQEDIPPTAIRRVFVVNPEIDFRLIELSH
jgi:hypothetical protein